MWGTFGESISFYFIFFNKQAIFFSQIHIRGNKKSSIEGSVHHQPTILDRIKWEI